MTNKTDKHMNSIAGAIHELMDIFSLDEVKLDVRLQADSKKKDVHLDEHVAHLHVRDHGGAITVRVETTDEDLPAMIAAPLLDLAFDNIVESACQAVKHMHDTISEDDVERLADDIISHLFNESGERGERDA